MRTLLLTIGPLIVTGIMVFSIVDIVTIDSSRARHLPKPVWILLVILLPLIGSLLWFLLGRERLQKRNNGRYRDTGPGAAPAALGPDDDPEFLRRLQRERDQQERIRELEERLADLDDDKPKE